MKVPTVEKVHKRQGDGVNDVRIERTAFLQDYLDQQAYCPRDEIAIGDAVIRLLL